jgi:hypothetical protein
MQSVIMEDVDFKVHYDYHNTERCTAFSVAFDVLTCIDYADFSRIVQDNVPYLRRLASVRICFKDQEGHWVDVDERNYTKFVKTGKLINIRVVDGMSPCHSKSVATEQKHGQVASKRQLFDSASGEKTFIYQSPLEIDIELKQNELRAKEMEFEEYKRKYEQLDNEYNPKVPRATGKLCHKCHTRDGHTRSRCKNEPCTNVVICGELDVHPESKKELVELASLKNKADGELKKFKSEVEVKQKIKNQMLMTFENKIHEQLIRTNPEKYLIGGVGQAKKRVLDADKAILRKYYNGKAPEHLDVASITWQALIDAEMEKWNVGQRKPQPPRNPVLEMMTAASAGVTTTSNTNVCTTRSIPQYSPSQFCSGDVYGYQHGYPMFPGGYFPQIPAMASPNQVPQLGPGNPACYPNTYSLFGQFPQQPAMSSLNPPLPKATPSAATAPPPPPGSPPGSPYKGQ